MDPQQPDEPIQPPTEPPAVDPPATDAAPEVPAPASPSQPPSSPPPAAPAPVPAPVAAWTPAPAAVAPGPTPGVEFAPHVGRLIAYIIDGFIVGIVVFIVAIVLTPLLLAGASTNNSGATASAAFLYVFIVLLISVGYFPFFWARSGQTPGMKIFGLHVVRDADGGKISGGTAVIRLIGLWISFAIFYLGIIWILVDSRRRGWHDLLAGTCVVRQP
jgi:uncharacterized RDD family membrane protein YckC